MARLDVGDAAFTSVPGHVRAVEGESTERERDGGVYRWRRQLSAPLTAGRERRCRRTADRVVALSEHGEPARVAARSVTSIFSSRRSRAHAIPGTGYENTFHALTT